MTDTTTVEQVASIPGFVGRGRYRRVECDWFEAQEGAEPLWAELRADLPFGLLEALPVDGKASYNELWDAISFAVRSWNCLGLDLTTGTYQPVPPPCEGGRESFRSVDPQIGLWIGIMLKQTYKTVTTDPKAPSESESAGSTASSLPDAISAPSDPVKKSRRNQQD